MPIRSNSPTKWATEIVAAIIRHSKGETLPPQILIPTRLYRQADAATDPELAGPNNANSNSGNPNNGGNP